MNSLFKRLKREADIIEQAVRQSSLPNYLTQWREVIDAARKASEFYVKDNGASFPVLYKIILNNCSEFFTEVINEEALGTYLEALTALIGDYKESCESSFKHFANRLTDTTERSNAMGAFLELELYDYLKNVTQNDIIIPEKSLGGLVIDCYVSNASQEACYEAVCIDDGHYFRRYTKAQLRDEDFKDNHKLSYEETLKRVNDRIASKQLKTVNNMQNNLVVGLSGRWLYKQNGIQAVTEILQATDLTFNCLLVFKHNGSCFNLVHTAKLCS